MKEILIKIPEKAYERFEHEYKEKDLISPYVAEVILKAFTKGMVLPKGHGDIVDMKTLADMFWDGNSMEITRDDLSVIEPLIEADKTENEAREGLEEPETDDIER